MTNRRIKDGDHVVPGERLGVIEEFLPGSGTFQGEDDMVYANITGHVRIDMKERKIRVEPTTRTPCYPCRNDVIYGTIQSVSKNSAIVNIYQVGDIHCPIPFTGHLFIKNAAAGYVDQLRDLFNPGDFIIARIQQQTEGISRLSTIGPRFGVFRAYCSLCGEILHRHGNRLECEACGHREQRKLSKEYGKVFDIEPEEDEEKLDETED